MATHPRHRHHRPGLADRVGDRADYAREVRPTRKATRRGFFSRFPSPNVLILATNSSHVGPGPGRGGGGRFTNVIGRGTSAMPGKTTGAFASDDVYIQIAEAMIDAEARVRTATLDDVRRARRISFMTASTSPNCLRARASASSGVMPAFTWRSVRMSM